MEKRKEWKGEKENPYVFSILFFFSPFSDVCIFLPPRRKERKEKKKKTRNKYRKRK